MFVTPLNFIQVLERFYHQDKYDLMLLFVSSFDGNDRTIIHEIVDNAKRIDRITGERICFFYFVKETYDDMNEKLVRWVRDISDWTPLYGEGVSVTMETADDICKHFGMMRSNLPAFILVNKDRIEEPHVFSVHEYQDFENFLTPLNILHSFIEDRESILFRYESKKRHILAEYESKRKRTVVTQYDVDKRRQERLSWKIEIDRLYNRRDTELSRGETERARKREAEIEKYKKKLEDYPEVVICGEDESVLYPQIELNNLLFPQGELDSIFSLAVEKLNIALNSHDGNTIISLLQNGLGYTDAVLKVWQLVGTRGVRLSKILEHIRYEIHERGFDVFISCKSQDYGLAHELYDFLVHSGYKPFLADSSIKEVGIDQYTALIGEVINVCQYMVVFATDVCYLETPYVAAEWHAFINDINTGHKPNAKIVSVLSPDIDPQSLPNWLRDKQCFTTENYKDFLIRFLQNGDDEQIERLFEEIKSIYYCIKNDANRLLRRHGDSDMGMVVYRFIDDLERERYCIESRLDSYQKWHNNHYDLHRIELEGISGEIRVVLRKWEKDFWQLSKDVEQSLRNDEDAWQEAMRVGSMESIKDYLARFPHGAHHQEARDRLLGYKRCAPSRQNEEYKMVEWESRGRNELLIRKKEEERKRLKEDPLRQKREAIEEERKRREEEIKKKQDLLRREREAKEECNKKEREKRENYKQNPPHDNVEANPATSVVDDGDGINLPENTPASTSPEDTFAPVIPHKRYFWNKFFSKKIHEVYSSIFAPAEVKRKTNLQVQVFLHLLEETDMVKTLAKESDRNAVRRGYIPLQCKLKKGDKVDVLLNVYGETLLMSDKKSIVWQGSFTKCSFDYFVPKDIDVDELSCMALLSVNGVPVGEMRFITKIVETPRKRNPEIIAHKYSKVFISYSHEDESKVKFLHEGLELGAVPHFFDRKYLKAGDVFPQVIRDYINSADLFILCWSENASKSEYVKKERLQALERAFPQVRPEKAAKLRIYPMSIEPRAELPSDMKEYYHFGEI